jgi:Na+/melibiose symporter-like transporter
VIALVAGQFLLPTSRDPKTPRVDWVGAALSMAGLSALVYALIEAPLRGWASTSTLGFLALALVVLAVFAWWEWRTREPMLDIRFFENPRFTAACVATTLVFFALMGAMFSMTQYFQFVLGYSPLESGVRMMPMALGMVIGAPVSARLVEHVGAKVVVTAGLTVVAAGLVLMSFVTESSSYPQFLTSLMVMALGMGFTMAPATEAIMGAIPRSKAGVGSAMNDTTRQVGAALGVATIGSLMSSMYRSEVAEALVGLPPEAAAAARDSLGAALAIASQSGAAGEALRAAANHAFVEAISVGLLAGAAVALGGAVIALVWLPAEGTEMGDDFAVRDGGER